MTQAKTDCEALMASTLPFAEQMLAKHGEFFPFGAAMQADGKIISVGAFDGNEHPPSTEVIRLLKKGLVEGAQSRQYKATALIYDVRAKLPTTGETSDAIAVSLNHQDNFSLIVFHPYQLQDGKLTFGAIFAQKGEADIFVAAP